MSNKTIEKLVNNLSREIVTLRSLVISVIKKDEEGMYKSSFVNKILKNAKNKQPIRFTNGKDFLAQLKG